MSFFSDAELIYKGKTALIYRGRYKDYQEEIAVKVFNKSLPTAAEIIRFNEEFELSKSLDHPNLRKSIGIEKIESKPVLLLEHVRGITLEAFVSETMVPTTMFMRIAIQLTSGLEAIHAKNIVHKNLSSTNILINRENEEVKIIDFSLAKKYNRKNPLQEHVQTLEGELKYISPEQTGRMNRFVDARSDLYSLGVVFYKVLSGRCPFEMESPMELVHAHIAKVPQNLHSLRPDHPKILSDIVMKLLSKNAENRYQSASGLKVDLLLCQEKLKSGKPIDFELAEQDFTGVFQISQKLYGRENEKAVLNDLIDGVSRGRMGHLFVGGFSGSGKSALIQEVRRSASMNNGLFINGKFDQFQRNIPYFSWRQALNEFINYILALPSQLLGDWKQRLNAAVGSNGKLLLDLLPNLELIIGPQPDVAELSGEEAQNRFNYLIQSFIKAIATLDHPIIFFLDDLQWADAASLKLLRLILSNNEISSLLIIGAYRNNEVDLGHILQITFNEIESELGHLNQLALNNLSKEHVLSLISDTLYPNADCTDLAKIVYNKTQGNAFYTISFLKSLHQDDLVIFNENSKLWTWDINKIKSLASTENVGQFMAGEVIKLPREMTDILKLASCIGNEFEVQDLLPIANCSKEDLILNIENGIEEGVVIPLLKDQYRFTHDQVQQALYTLIPKQDRGGTHLLIGRSWLRMADDDANYLAAHVFDIVNQFAQGWEQLRSEDEKTRISELNFKAGEKAHASAAYFEAHRYLQAGIELLDTDVWKDNYPYALLLYTQMVNTSAMCNEIDDLERYSNIVFYSAKTILEKVPVYEIKIHAYTALNKYSEVIDIGLEILNLLGEKFPKNPGKIHVLLGLIKTRWLLGRTQIDSLATKPMMSSPIKMAASRIIASMGTSAMFGKPNLLPLIALRVVQLAIRYGNTPEITRGYAGYAMILCGGVGDIKSGSQFGKMAIQSCDTISNSTYRVSTVQIYNTCIRHYTEHAANTLVPLKEGYIKGLESGDYEAADFSLANYYFHRYFVGDNLEVFESEFREACEIIEKHQRTQVHNLISFYYQTAHNLMHTKERPWVLEGDVYNESDKLPLHIKEKDATALFLLYYHKMTLAYLFDEWEEATACAAQARKNIEGGISLMASVLFWGFDSLIRLARCRLLDKSQRRTEYKIVKRNQKKLHKFAKYCPANYQHLYQLVQAERASSKEQYVEARTYYDQSIARARVGNYKNIEAIASECAGRSHMDEGNSLLAQFYLENAFIKYFEWGAKSKLKFFENRYHSMLLNSESIRKFGTSNHNSLLEIEGRLDLNSVLKASQTIAREISLERLLSEMMKVILENAGAEKGLLILKEENRWLVEGEIHLDSMDQPITMQSLPVEQVGGGGESALLSLSIFDFVVRTAKSLVLEDATRIGQFTKSGYVQRYQPKSILCSPLAKQGELIGCFYLENNQTTGAFTPERVAVLEMLSSQMAISIVNARLYENLEEKVNSRTLQLVQEKEKTEEAYENIKMLSQIGQRINSSLSLDKVIDTVYENINQIMPTTTFGIGIYNANANKIEFSNVVQEGHKVSDFSCDGSDMSTYSNWCFRHERELFISDQRSNVDPHISILKADVGTDMRSIIYLPLMINEVAKGIITVQSSEPDVYTSQHLNILKNLAVYAVTAIAHAGEYERSEQLLLNILPKSTALELKEKGRASSKLYEMASVLFTDFKGFTLIAANMTPEEIVENLDYCFRAFDRITKKHGLEKIKTIGDSYMCAGGIPIANRTNPIDTVNAAFDMIDFMKKWKAEKEASGKKTWEIRLGIHTGRVVAGVVGQDKFAYDIWGDAVNTASRMESSGVPGKINVSGATFALIRDEFDCTYRGKVNAKNKGEIDMYFVDRAKN